MAHTVAIVGGGFGGLTAAMKLAQKKLPDVEVHLYTDTPYLTYFGALYRVLRGRPISQACIPLSLILPSSVRLVVDRIESVDTKKKTLQGGSGMYKYTTLVLAPGAEPAYFGIKGMEKQSEGMMSVAGTLRLREKIISSFERATKENRPARFAVIGAGATGIEIAGEIATFHKHLPASKQAGATIATVELVEASSRLLSTSKPFVSERLLHRLQSLGVHTHLSTRVLSVSAGALQCAGGVKMEADCIIWTAGVQPSSLVRSVESFTFDNRGRVQVDSQLKARGHKHIYIAGDCASTAYAGMAQTAVHDGAFIASAIAAEMQNRELPVYKPKSTAYAIPAGEHWAAVKFGFVYVFGFLGSLLRRLADLHVYMLILSPFRVLQAYTGTIDLSAHNISFSSKNTQKTKK